MYLKLRSQTTCRPADVPGVFIFLDGQKDPLRNRASGMPFFNHTKGAAERPCQVFVLDESYTDVLSWMKASVATRPPQYGVLRIVVVLFAFLCRKRTATLGK